jgi:hypothetical protein
MNEKDTLVQLCIDVYDGNAADTNFSNKDADESIRQKFIEIVGTDKIDYKIMRRSGALVFEIMEEALKILVERRLEAELSKFAEYRNIAWGDKKTFELENPNLFEVSTIADGNGNLIRQRIDNGSLTVDTFARGVKIYENFYRLIAGRTNWSSLVNKIAESYINKIYGLVYSTMYDSYNSAKPIYNITGSYSTVELDNMIDHVEAANNAEAIIIGTRNALSRVNPTYVSETMKSEYNQKGFFGIHNGRQTVEIKQTHTSGTDTFAINNNFLMVLPAGSEKVVKIVDEGDAVIKEGQTGMDMSQEYLFVRKSGVALVSSSRNGIYRLA